MASGYTQFYDMLRGLVDSIAHEGDEVQRLKYLRQFRTDALRMALKARDEAAYDLRSRYSSEDAEALTGIPRRHIDYWVKRHRKATGLPPVPRRERIDLSGAVDLSGGTASHIPPAKG